MEYWLILPHQLFDKRYVNKKYKYYLYEHPHYFKKYNYNKKKLLLHRSSMKYYYDYLKNNGYNISYINFNKSIPEKHYNLFDPIDKIILPENSVIHNSPNFLLSNEMCEKYQQKTKKYFFTPFYYTVKKWLNIIPNIKSQDKSNRHKILDKDIKDIPIISKLYDEDIYYIEKAKSYINKHFSENCGTLDNFIFPVTHNTIKKWLNYFIQSKLDNFGKYQDAIHTEHNLLYHSVLSSAINIGLINPNEIIKIILKSNTAVNNLEGFIRQLFWREYQRYCYKYIDFKNYKSSINTKHLTNKWYNGTLGIKPVDDCIIKAFKIGYLHHIERLMIVGNYMNISLINPDDGYKWFMEFSCDSYEWVMSQNVYDMVFYTTRGKTMRRPYISSSKYILRMSNYRYDSWCDIWNEKYNNYIKLLKLRNYKQVMIDSKK